LSSEPGHKNIKKLAPVWRPLIEVGFIVFLFYSNLLMGEYVQSGVGQTRGLVWAVLNIFTATNFVIAIVAALVGYLAIEFLRNRL
jgi:hypothetical protein